MDDITDATNMNLGKLRVMVRDREAWRVVVHGVAKSQKQLEAKQQQAWDLPKSCQGQFLYIFHSLSPDVNILYDTYIFCCHVPHVIIKKSRRLVYKINNPIFALSS